MVRMPEQEYSAVEQENMTRAGLVKALKKLGVDTDRLAEVVLSLLDSDNERVKYNALLFLTNDLRIFDLQDYPPPPAAKDDDGLADAMEAHYNEHAGGQLKAVPGKGGPQ